MPYFYLTTEMIIHIHDKILEDEPGLPGISRDKSLDGALGRIHNHSQYNGVNDLHEIAALYGIALGQGHVFNDGNKRTSLMAMFTFLSIHGYTILMDEEETKEIILQVAQKELSLKELANWLRINSVDLDMLKKVQRRFKRK